MAGSVMTTVYNQFSSTYMSKKAVKIGRAHV